MASVREHFIQEQIKLEKRFNANGRSLLEASENKLTLDDATDAYLSNRLEYVDTYLHKPLQKYFAMRDMPMLMVGGAKEVASYFKANYSASVGGGLASGNSNVITTVKAQLAKQSSRIVPSMYVLEYGYIDEMKANEIGFDFLTLFDEGIRAVHNFDKDDIAYFGLKQFRDLTGNDKSFGLLNNPDVTIKQLASGKTFESMTGAEIVELITGEVIGLYETLAFDGRLLPDRLLVPASFFKRLVLPLAVAGQSGGSATTGTSTLEYVRNSVQASVADESVTLSILPLPYLVNAGANGNGRMVMYKYDPEVARMPVGMDLTRGATMFDPSSVSTKTFYHAFLGEPQFIYPSAIRYIDNN